MDKKEAIEIVRNNFPNGRIHLSEALMTLIPELKESKDEQHRKWILEYLYDGMRKSDEQFKDQFKCAIDWLEKQGEMDMESYKAAEDEKREFVGDGFIKCYADFQDFKEGETYWLEYMGNDNYNVRSDNLLGKTYHITPCQLYTIFKKQTWLEKQEEQKNVWNENDDAILNAVIQDIQERHPDAMWNIDTSKTAAVSTEYVIKRLKSLKPQSHWKPSEEQLQTLHAQTIEGAVSYPEDVRILISLYNNLLKLK